MDTFSPSFQQEVLHSHERVCPYESNTIQMFDHFIGTMVPFIIQEFSKLDLVHETTSHRIQFSNVCIHRPTAHESDISLQTMKAQNTEPMRPMEARTRNLTYSASILVDVVHQYHEDGEMMGAPTIYKGVPLCAMPIMVGSKYCWTTHSRSDECVMDRGGYFIIRGNTKVLQPQKKPRINIPVIRKTSDGIHCEIRSLRADEKYRSSSTLYLHILGSPPIMKVDIPFMKTGLNACLPFKLLGFEEAEIRQCIQIESRILDSTLHALHQIDNIYSFSGDKYDADKTVKVIQGQMCGEFLPHVGLDDSPETKYKKAIYYGYILRRMILIAEGREEPDDRDFEGFKSVEMSAAILSVLFRQLFNNYIRKTLRNKMFDRLKKGKHIDLASSIIHSESLTRDIHRAFSDGEVTVQKDSSNAGMGVIQMASTTNCLNISTHLTRVSTPLPRDNKYTIARQVDTTHLGAFCPAETPEGEGAGLLQNLATFAHVRLGIQSSLLIPTIQPLIDPIDSDGLLVCINSEPIGKTRNAPLLTQQLRNLKQFHQLPYDCSIIRTVDGVFISSDMGVITIPIIDIEQYKIQQVKVQLYISQGQELWTVLLDLGIVLFVDPWELLEFRVAFLPSDITPEFTHIFPHPCFFFATCASTTPYLNHNQAPRIPYQAGMVKQAIGITAFNQDQRFDLPAMYQLWYPQNPVCDSDISKAKQIHEYPLGQNLIIAIASHKGLTAEDSIVFNRATSERGACRVYVSKMFKSSCKKGDKFENPIQDVDGVACIMLRGNTNYETVENDGLPPIGLRLHNNDVLIGKVSYSMSAEGEVIRRDRSVILTCNEEEEHIVTDVILTTGRDGILMAKIKTRTLRILQEGDKLASRHGQKGTVGYLESPENMPFVASGPNAGMVPDVIINLHCMNGRMTLGKEIEILMSNVGLVFGEFQDATAFKDVNIEEAIDHLQQEGYGTEEWMINGMSGEPIQHPWFIGSCFYQVLKHFVIDKMTARQRGPRAALTRQPVDGRANHGGQRFGEMEVQVLEAHGAAYCLDDRMRISADSHELPVCRTCGHTVELMKPTLNELQEDSLLHCRQCNGTDIVLLPTTYSYGGLFLKELATLGIKVSHQIS